MAKQDAGFVDKHIEKVAVGLCALVLIGAVGYTFVMGRFTLNGRGPAALVEEAAEEAQRTAAAISRAKPKPLRQDTNKDDDDPIDSLARSFGPNRVTLPEFADIEPDLARTQLFPPLFLPVTERAAAERCSLAQIVAPGPPLVRSGRTTFRIPSKKDLKDFVQSRTDDSSLRTVTRNWISVASQIDLVEQYANFKAEGYPAGSGLVITKVHLQRLDKTEPWRGWENVNTYLPFEPLDPRSFKSAETRTLIEETAEHITRPKLPIRKSGDKIALPPIPYLDAPPDMETKDKTPSELESAATRRVAKWTRAAQDAFSGKRAFKGNPDFRAAYILASAAAATTNAKEKELQKTYALLEKIESALKKADAGILSRDRRVPERLMPILAHDLDIVPGHSYVYRMRYEVLNVFAGNPGQLRNPEDADRDVLLSGWSPQSLPTTLESDVYFFLTKADRAKQEATITVFKKTRRGHERKDYTVKVGDKIGKKEKRGKKTDFDTGVICVGLDFSGKRDAEITFVNEGSGVLGTRVLSRDRKSKLYKSLLK